MQLLLISVSGVCAVYILLNCATQFILALQALRASSHPLRREENSASLPSVLVQLPIYNEQHVVERLITAAAALDYPKHKLIIQLLDDSTDTTSSIAAEAIAKLAGTGGHPIHHVRRGHRDGFKAGALSHGMQLAPGDLIAIFDADFMPQPDFLLRVAPQFADPAIGLVQTRWAHTNSNYNILTRLMAIAIDNHFAVEHAGKQRSGAFINFNGTAGVWRRKTIEQAGGWSSDSLTEDLDLSFRAQFAGWKFLYLDEIETASELPAVLSDLRSQQFRWTKGAVETGRKLLRPLWQCNAPIAAKLIGTLQLTNGLVFPTVLIFGLAALCFHFLGTIEYGRAFLLICALLLVSSLATSFSFGASQWIRGKRSLREMTKAFYNTQLFVVFSTGFGVQNSFAVYEGLIGRKTEFVRTAKHAITSSGQNQKPKARMRRLPKSFFFELVLALGFITSAMTEMSNSHPKSLPLLMTMAVFGVGYFLMVSLELSDFFGFEWKSRWFRNKMEAADADPV